MAKVFHVTSTGSEVRLDGDGKGEINYTASNAAGRPLRAHAVLVPLGSTDKSWLSIDGEAERPLPVDATEQFTVRVAVPAGTEPGAYRFRLDVVSEENPDEDFAEGPVSVIQATPRKTGQPFPWWILAVVAGVLILGGLIYWLARSCARPAPEEPRILRFEARPASIQAGERAELVWEVAGADSRTISPGVGDVGVDGRHRVSPSATTEYELVAGNEAGEVSSRVTVRVRRLQRRSQVHKQGSFKIRQTWTADLDEGVEGGAPGERDFWFQAATATERYIVPQNGAVMGASRGPIREPEACNQVRMSGDKIPVDRAFGLFFCVKTNQGRISTFRLTDPVGRSPGTMAIEFITWEP